MFAKPSSLLSALLFISGALHVSAQSLKARDDHDEWSNEPNDDWEADKEDEWKPDHSGWQNGGKVHWVQVGPDGRLEYDPPYIHAAIGDTVTFQFKPKNHTVTQSSFENPCESNGGFKSGFMPVAPDAQHFPTFDVKVHDVSPYR